MMTRQTMHWFTRCRGIMKGCALFACLTSVAILLAAVPPGSDSSDHDSGSTEPTELGSLRSPTGPSVANSGFEEFLVDYQDMTYDQLLAKLHRQREYVPSLSFDPTEATYFDSIKQGLQLTDEEVAIFKRNGFVSINQNRRHSFGSAYYQIYTSDLPVLITTDSILHALHRSYDAVLMELETHLFTWTLEEMLFECHEALSEIDQDDHDTVPSHNLRDVDLYLSVARNLLAGAGARKKKGGRYGSQHVQDGILPVASVLDQDQEVLARLRDIESLKIQVPFQDLPTEIYGGRRYVDYSQFRPRGHYAKNPALERYFRCMMWLGRADCGWNVSSTDHIPGIDADSDRELQNAVLLTDLIDSTDNLERLKMLDDIINFMVGRSDNLSVFDTHKLLTENGIETIDGAVNVQSFAKLKTVIESGKYTQQRIRSQAIISNPNDTYKVPPPSLFQMFGHRFAIDSLVLSHVVFDSIIYQDRKQLRMMPTGLDVMAALGNSEAIPLLNNELQKWNYSANLMAAHTMVNARQPSFWKDNLYNVWLDCLRMLDQDTCGKKNAPEVMKTHAWQMKQLQTQLASWSELRHDNVLYAKQSYTSMPSCKYPAGYVEPYPEFYAKVRFFADEATRLLDATSYVVRDAKRSARLDHIKERQLQFFRTMSGVLAKLEVVATKELNAQPLTLEEQSFLEKTIDKRGNIRFGSGQRPHYDGWYCDLIYDGLIPPLTPMKWDPTIVDVHTDPESRTVLEVGVGDVNLCVIAIDNEEDFMAYVGPIFSYYEFRHPAEDRLTDQQWQEMISNDQLPDRPEWTQVFQAPARKRPKDGVSATTKGSGYTFKRLPNQR